MILQRYTFGSKSQPLYSFNYIIHSCLWYCKDIHLEANHNLCIALIISSIVAYDIAKIYIWKQITTLCCDFSNKSWLLMILQRYTFGSKSQRSAYNDCSGGCCLWYCKDIHLEANHNATEEEKQAFLLLMILQRYTFGSKSQHKTLLLRLFWSCLWYCKDIHLEANHNRLLYVVFYTLVAYDIAKIYIWKQITTRLTAKRCKSKLLMILQRYTFGSKSQLKGWV